MTDCGPVEHPGDLSLAKLGTECTINTANTPGKPITVHEQFQRGTFLLREENFDEAIAALRPVASLWQPDMTTFSDNCQQYIKVARAFVDGNDASGPRHSSGDWSQSNKSDRLLIAPNPASNAAILYMPEENYQFKIWDLQGRLIQQATASGNYRVETAAWSPGVYVVEVRTAEGEVKSGKLIVQK